jgi:hypothetical protein
MTSPNLHIALAASALAALALAAGCGGSADTTKKKAGSRGSQATTATVPPGRVVDLAQARACLAHETSPAMVREVPLSRIPELEEFVGKPEAQDAHVVQVLFSRDPKRFAATPQEGTDENGFLTTPPPAAADAQLVFTRSYVSASFAEFLWDRWVKEHPSGQVYTRRPEEIRDSVYVRYGDPNTPQIQYQVMAKCIGGTPR